PWAEAEDYWDVYWDITREVKMRFDREGISIPFPQRDVHFPSNLPHLASQQEAVISETSLTSQGPPESED
ncbi:MAG: mechanosensitive ion channel family protein, partial [Deltaproteobacteria bacterium]|nr:mechanosensitive ion channel family protein [Deltaproteobacteria bacterium]